MRRSATAKFAVPRKLEKAKADIYYFLFGCLEGNLSNCSFRRTLPAEAGWFDQRFPFSGDFEFWVRANRLTGVLLDDKLIIHIRSHDAQASKHLNRRGELMPQIAAIFEDLYRKIESRYPPWLLRLQYSIALDCQHRWTGLKWRLRGKDDGQYLAQLDGATAISSRLSLPWPSRWALFALSGCGRLGKIALTRAVLANPLPQTAAAKKA